MKKLIKATIKSSPKKTTITLRDIDKELKAKIVIPAGQCMQGKPLDIAYVKMLAAFLEDQETKLFNREANAFLKELFDEASN